MNARPDIDAPRGQIIDPFGRRIHYVRLSVTDRCNFRCVYCMPEEGVEFTHRDELLNFEEIERIGRVMTEMGVDRIRLTGGEPTVRRDVLELVSRLGALPRLEDLAMTTNGWNLAKIGADLKAAGLTRLNISIDTLDRERFIALARVDRLDDVLAGIEAVVALDWLPLKLNVVVCEGMNEDEVCTFVERFAHLPVTIRFIEYMPFGESRFKLVPWSRSKARLEARWTLEPVPGPKGSGPANYWSVAGTKVVVGAIGALSRQFCEACNRVRITSDGRLKTCLAYEPQMVSLRDVLRGGGSDDDLETAIRAGIARKPVAHVTGEDGSNPFEGQMIQIGG